MQSSDIPGKMCAKTMAPGSTQRQETVPGRGESKTYDEDGMSELSLAKLNAKKRRPKERTRSFLARLTHMTLTDKELHHIPASLRACKSLQVLYLYNNRISAIENLDFGVHLTHLYLQNNQLHTLEGLREAKSLQKLYVDHNCISRVSGIEHLGHLTELHISSQKIDLKRGLEFDPISLRGISASLQILNCSCNGIKDLNLFAALEALAIADFSYNDVCTVQAMNTFLSSSSFLTELNLERNPLCCLPHYRESVIVQSIAIETLDGKPVRDSQREFMQRMVLRRGHTPSSSATPNVNSQMRKDYSMGWTLQYN